MHTEKVNILPYVLIYSLKAVSLLNTTKGFFTSSDTRDGIAALIIQVRKVQYIICPLCKFSLLQLLVYLFAYICLFLYYFFNQGQIVHLT